MKDSYNTINSLKNSFTIYRNYLKANIPLDKKLDRKSLLATLLRILRLTPKQLRIFNEAAAIDIKDNKSNLRHLYDPEGYINIAAQLLDSSSYIDQVLGLCALTGRRAAEIGSTAKFKFIDEYTVEFSGQLKTKGRTDVLPYEIPVLFNAHKLIQVLEILRETKPRFIDNPALFHDSASSPLAQKTKKYFTGIFEGTPQVKDLRAIYALLSYVKFNKLAANKKIDRDVYFAQILGHSENDTTTCGSYVDFFLA